MNPPRVSVKGAAVKDVGTATCACGVAPKEVSRLAPTAPLPPATADVAAASAEDASPMTAEDERTALSDAAVCANNDAIRPNPDCAGATEEAAKPEVVEGAALVGGRLDTEEEAEAKAVNSAGSTFRDISSSDETFGTLDAEGCVTKSRPGSEVVRDAESPFDGDEDDEEIDPNKAAMEAPFPGIGLLELGFSPPPPPLEGEEVGDDDDANKLDNIANALLPPTLPPTLLKLLVGAARVVVLPGGVPSLEAPPIKVVVAVVVIIGGRIGSFLAGDMVFDSHVTMGGGGDTAPSLRLATILAELTTRLTKPSAEEEAVIAELTFVNNKARISSADDAASR